MLEFFLMISEIDELIAFSVLFLHYVRIPEDV